MVINQLQLFIINLQKVIIVIKNYLILLNEQQYKIVVQKIIS